MTFMSKSASRTSIPVITGRLVKSAYIFNDEVNTHGVVLTLDDDSDISIEFDCETRLVSKVLQCKSADDEAILLQTVA